MLTQNQIKKGKEWERNHSDHIKKIVKETALSYPPTDTEEKNNPAF